MRCPCGSGRSFSMCCEPYLTRVRDAPTPEALMRSRYTAYVKGDFHYIEMTMMGPAKAQFDQKEAEVFAQKTHWLTLEVLRVDERGEEGTVEFRAHYSYRGEKRVLYEVSLFRRVEGKWFYFESVSEG